MFSNFFQKLFHDDSRLKPVASITGDPEEDKAAAEDVFGKVPLDGRRKSLLIGINYMGQTGQLSGCINDVISIRNYLKSVGFKTDNEHMMVLLEDKANATNGMLPTRENILKGFKWLIAGAKPGDSLFFHYSGHGTRVRDTSGDELDGYDEAIVPLDFDRQGLIIDDEIYEVLLKPLPRGCRMTAVMDCCNSGTAFDLPFVFKANEQMENYNFSDLLPFMLTNLHWDFKNVQSLVKQGVTVEPHVWGAYKKCIAMNDDEGAAKVAGSFEPKSDYAVYIRHVCADVVMISGCKDSQTSADVYDVSDFKLKCASGPGEAGGACTTALLACLADNPNSTYVSLLDRMRKLLKEKHFSQVPQLSSSKKVELTRHFSLVE